MPDVFLGAPVAAFDQRGLGQLAADGQARGAADQLKVHLANGLQAAEICGELQDQILVAARRRRAAVDPVKEARAVGELRPDGGLAGKFGL